MRPMESKKYLLKWHQGLERNYCRVRVRVRVRHKYLAYKEVEMWP